VVEPHIKSDLRDLSFAPNWEFEVEAGPNWGNRQRHQLYYSVAPQFANANRASYTAGAGYGGMQASLTAARRFGKWYAGGFLRYDSIRGASFEPSPLVRRKDNFSFAAGLTYVFAESDRMVEVLR
jgi:MipA family protein